LEPVKAQITFDAIAKKSEYINAPPEVQADVAYRFFEDNFASKPAYKRATPEVQADARARFMADYNVPKIEMDDAQRVEAPEFEPPQGFNPLRELNKGLTTINLAAGAFADPFSDAMTLGYGDSKERNERVARQQFPGIETDQGLLGMAYRAHQNPIANAAGGFAGMVGGRGLASPFTAATQWAGGLLKGQSILANMGREALSGLAVGAAYKPGGEDWLNLPGRFLNAGVGAVTGGALPLVGKALKGGIKAVQNFHADPRPISAMGRDQVEQQLQARIAESMQKQVMGQKVYQVRLQAVASELQKLRAESGPIIQMQVDKKLAKIASGKVTPGELNRIQMFVKNAPRIKQAQKESAFVQKAKTKQQDRPEQQPQEIQQQPGQQTTEQSQGEIQTVEKPAPVVLTGSVKEMVDKALESFGGTIDDAKALLGQVKALGKAEDDEVIKPLQEQLKALPKSKEAKAERGALKAKIDERKAERKALRDKAGTIHGNLKEVLNTGWDGESAVADQLPVDTTKQKTFDEVKHLLEGNALKEAEKLNKQMEQGFSVRVEHTAEISGSTDAAVKVTGKGNVKVPPSTYTPTHWTIVKKGDKEYAAALGYNEAGHQHMYYPTSPEGSSFKVTKLLDTEQHIGTTPNVYLGVRKYKPADVLKRKPEGEGILTSEAMTNAKAFASLFKTETIAQFSKDAQKAIREVQKRGRFDESDLRSLLKMLEGKKEDLVKVCQLFNLKMGP
jgi:hypothetical protein